VLREWLKEELSANDRAKVLVWYDPGGSLLPLADEELCPERQLIQFHGSYIAVRLALERQDPRFEQRWLVYVPESPPDRSWLRDWELFGAREQLGFLTVLRRRGPPVDQDLKDIVAKLGPAVRQLTVGWDTMVGAMPLTKAAVVRACLALLFRQPSFSFQSAVLQFITTPSLADQIKQAGLYDIWQSMVVEELGFTDMPSDPEDFRQRLTVGLLLGELVHQDRQLTGHFENLLPSLPKRALAASIAGLWRTTSSLQHAYREAVLEIEKTYAVADKLQVSSKLLRSATFRVVDELLIRQAEVLAGKNGSAFAENRERLREISTARSELFWASSGDFPSWPALELATELQASLRGCLQANGRIRGLGQPGRCLRRTGRRVLEARPTSSGPYFIQGPDFCETPQAIP